MNKTLRISFSLKNTYRVNSILYSIKQIPLIKRLLPDSLYQVHGLKIFANVISVIWEVISVFLGKFLYLALMVIGMGSLYKTVPQEQLFFHILLFLSIIGAFTNTYMFNPTKDKYYAVILMRMDARSYALVNYGYAILKVIIGFLPFTIFLGIARDIPLWICILIPFSIAGLKLTVTAYSLWNYEKTHNATNENILGKFAWAAIALLLAAAYGLPVIPFLLPDPVMITVMILCVVSGLISLWKIFSFQEYRTMYQVLLVNSMHQMDAAKEISKKQSQKMISSDTDITSTKKGFEYLNELFIRRHQKILWKSSKRITMVCIFLTAAALLAFYLVPESRESVNGLFLTYLPYFVFIMYSINRGTNFTRALFMNCDHSLLTYSFFKEPKFVLKLFQIRLKEIIKVNLLPAFTIGIGLDVLFFVSGGTDNPLNYAVIFVSILCMSIFFSVHYLTIYYLLQPYNAGTEIKSGTYAIVLSATYFVCFFMMNLQMPTLIFGFMTIIFCVLYCVIACILIYKFAPKTFRLRV